VIFIQYNFGEFIRRRRREEADDVEGLLAAEVSLITLDLLEIVVQVNRSFAASLNSVCKLDSFLYQTVNFYHSH